jgi:hypothetical protein
MEAFVIHGVLFLIDYLIPIIVGSVIFSVIFCIIFRLMVVGPCLDVNKQTSYVRPYDSLEAEARQEWIHRKSGKGSPGNGAQDSRHSNT